MSRISFCKPEAHVIRDRNMSFVKIFNFILSLYQDNLWNKTGVSVPYSMYLMPPSPEWYELFDQKRAAASIWPITVSSTACLMLGAREMKGENGFSALTVRLFLLVFLQIATLYILDLQLILLPLHPARLKAFSLSSSIPSVAQGPVQILNWYWRA